MSFHHVPRRASNHQMPYVLLLIACALCGCSTRPWRGFPDSNPAGPRWPESPEPTRIEYIMAFDRHQQLYTESGGWRAMQRILFGEVNSVMQRPFALALHPSGGLLVADPGAACVHFYCWGRQRYLRLEGSERWPLHSPVGVAAFPDGRIVVSDSQANRLLLFGDDGRLIGPFAADCDFRRPAGLALNSARGELYVANVATHEVVVLNLSGDMLRRFGGMGAAPGKFNFPTHLALATNGNLIVSDALNFRVQVLTPEGVPVNVFGELGDKPGYFSKLKGVAEDPAGNILTVEGLYDALQMYTPGGELLLSIGSAGSGPGQFWLPAGLCVDPVRHLVFVADSYNHRVQVFRLLGGVPS